MTYEDDRRKIAQGWYDFFVLEKNYVQGIKEEILESWKRSRENKINYDQIFMEDKDRNCQNKSRKKNGRFIDISKPYMDDLYRVIDNSDFMITLLDKNGFVLDTVLNPRVIEKTQFKLINLSENRIGTNAMGSCLYLDKPIQTYAEEHYYKPLHKFTTSAAPIHDSLGNLIGCIGITGFAEDVSVHTLGMAIAASYAIENKIRLSENNNIKLLKKYTNAIYNTISDGLIVTDSKGRITYINNVTQNILDIEEESVIDKNINDILPGSIDFNKFLLQSTEFFNKCTVLNIGGKPTNCNVSLTKLKNDIELIGFVIMFNKVDSSIKIDHRSDKNTLFSFDDIIGESDSIKETIEIAKIASQGNSNILILGESGTGKELFAQSIHNNSLRRNKPFIDINCGALPLNLVEAELFGYEGGSYTGSKKEGQPGKFELANGGTIFLDEIGELPLSIQSTLLRVIQERKIRRIGGTSSIDIDIMIIAATNRDLFQEVQNKNFRSDLFYRLNVFNINLPPLRKNKKDIVILANSFVEKYNKIFNRRVENISQDVVDVFKRYNWPGNIRELENIIERAVQLAKNKKIEIDDLPVYLTMNNKKDIIDRNENISILKHEEIENIVRYLQKTKGNVKKTSELLGISRATLYRRITDHRINIDNYRN